MPWAGLPCTIRFLPRRLRDAGLLGADSAPEVLVAADGFASCGGPPVSRGGWSVGEAGRRAPRREGFPRRRTLGCASGGVGSAIGVLLKIIKSRAARGLALVSMLAMVGPMGKGAGQVDQAQAMAAQGTPPSLCVRKVG